MKSTDIVVVGSINVDIVLHVALHPVPGETILATGQSAGFGGKGANQAVAAARAGAAVHFVGAVGEDDAGPAARQNMTDAGIDTEFVRTVAGPTGAAYLTVADDGENSIIVVGGANSSLTVEDIDDVADLLTCAAVVVLQLEVPLVVVERAIAAATVVIVNAAPAQTLPPAVLAQVAC